MYVLNGVAGEINSFAGLLLCRHNMLWFILSTYTMPDFAKKYAFCDRRFFQINYTTIFGAKLLPLVCGIDTSEMLWAFTEWCLCDIQRGSLISMIVHTAFRR